MVVSVLSWYHMVSPNGDCPEIGIPLVLILISRWDFPYKPTITWGTPIYGNPSISSMYRWTFHRNVRTPPHHGNPVGTGLYSGIYTYDKRWEHNGFVWKIGTPQIPRIYSNVPLYWATIKWWNHRMIVGTPWYDFVKTPVCGYFRLRKWWRELGSNHPDLPPSECCCRHSWKKGKEWKQK